MEYCYQAQNGSEVGTTLDDIAGQRRLRTFLQGIAGNQQEAVRMAMSMVHRILICGPKGSGKDTLIQAAAATFQQSGYRYFCVTIPRDGELHQERVDEILKALNQEDCVLVIRHLEKLKEEEDLDYLLCMAQEKSHCLVVLAKTESLDKIKEEVQDCFQHYYAVLPDSEDREDLFRALFPDALRDCAAGFAGKTEKYGYGQLAALASWTAMKYENGGKEIENPYRFAEEMLKDFCPEPQQNKKAEAKAEQAETQLTPAVIQSLLQAGSKLSAEAANQEAKPDGKHGYELISSAAKKEAVSAQKSWDMGGARDQVKLLAMPERPSYKR